MNDETMTPASNNIFVDLGFEPEEALNLKLRSQLMIELDRFIHDRRLTQQQAADLLGIQQSRVSDLVRGKIGRFSVDTLVNLLGKAGRDVRLSVTERAA